MIIKNYITNIVISFLFLMSVNSMAASADDITNDANEALQSLYKANPNAKELAQTAKGILIFPSIWRAGLLVGGQNGDGVLVVNNQVDSFYNASSLTYGLQAGIKNYSYAIFLMTDTALQDLKDGGFEFGVGPTFVVVNQGDSASLTNKTLDQDLYVYFFDQSGLMAGLGLKGTKITPIVID